MNRLKDMMICTCIFSFLSLVGVTFPIIKIFIAYFSFKGKKETAKRRGKVNNYLMLVNIC